MSRTCRGCNHSGWDPDGPYCAHPKVLEKHPIGLLLGSVALAKICKSPVLPLWEKGKER